MQRKFEEEEEDPFEKMYERMNVSLCANWQIMFVLAAILIF